MRSRETHLQGSARQADAQIDCSQGNPQRPVFPVLDVEVPIEFLHDLVWFVDMFPFDEPAVWLTIPSLKNPLR